MGETRPIVAAAVMVLLTGALVLIYLRWSDEGEPWEVVGIQEVALTEDRTNILVLADTYRSASCSGHRVKVDRGGSAWKVKLETRRTSEWCTLEGCGWDGLSISELLGPAGEVPTGGCPPIYVLPLDEPAPDDVDLVLG